jgi:hypothetical protein
MSESEIATKKTFAVITAVLNEHDFLNYFIEYHISIGFNKIYILIDDSTDEQDDYIIKPELLSYVVFYKVTDFFTKAEIKKTLDGWPYKPNLIHTCLQRLYIQKLEEDYCILLGVDSFLYLNGQSIQEFMIAKKIEDDIALIFFQWCCFSSNQQYDYPYNILNTIHEGNMLPFKNNHFFTMSQRKLVDYPSIDSHFYKLKNNVIGWFNDKTYDIDHTCLNVWKIMELLQIQSKNIQDHACIIHLICRGLADCILKFYNQWNPNEFVKREKEKVLYDYIANNNLHNIGIDIVKDTNRLWHLRNVNTYPDKNDTLESIHNTFKDFPAAKKNEIRVADLLLKSNITKEQLQQWLKTKGIFLE